MEEKKPVKFYTTRWFSVAVVVGILIVGSVWFAGKDGQQPVSGASSRPPAYGLAAYDTGNAPDAATVARYQAALDSLAPLCTEDEAKLAAEIWASWSDLQKNGVTDESNLSLIGHIKEAIPVSAAPTNCGQVMAALLVLTENKQ